MRMEKMNGVAALAALFCLGAAMALPVNANGQQQPGSQQQQSKDSSFSYSNGSSMFKAYSYPNVPAPSLANTPQLNQLIQNNKLLLSLDAAIELTLQNNLDIAVAHYERPLAQLDLLRSKSGGAARGIQGAAVSNALFSGAIGAGLSNLSGIGGTGGGGFTGAGVTNTSAVSCCDPFTGFSFGWNNSSTPLNFESLTGVPVEGSHTANYSTFFGKGWLT